MAAVKGREQTVSCAIFVVLIPAGINAVSAHPLLCVGSNEDSGNATLIDNPEKSFAVYTELYTGSEAR